MSFPLLPSTLGMTIGQIKWRKAENITDNASGAMNMVTIEKFGHFCIGQMVTTPQPRPAGLQDHVHYLGN